MSTRAVLYARVSGDDRGKDGRNLAGQLEMCRQYAMERGYVVAAELAEDDRGASGAALDLDRLNQARQMARAGEYDVLVVREIDRLSRNLAKQLIVEQELQSSGVTIEYVLGEYSDTPEGNFQKNVKAVIAEYEREKIRERTLRARRQRARDGNVLVHGCAPFGYSEAKIDGKRTLVANDEEARIVRQIFTWYTEGDGENGPLSMYEIVKRLTAEGIPTRADTTPYVRRASRRGKWYRGSLARMLHSETYAGVWYYGRHHGENPKEHLIPIEVPAIVSRDVWQAAQARSRRNQADSPRNTKYHHLLQRRMTCGDCGASMSAATARCGNKKAYYHYYYCLARRQPGYLRECPRKGAFRADYVDAAVWAWVRSLLIDPEALTAGLKATQEAYREMNRPLRERLTIVDDLVANHQSQLERALDLYLSGEFDKDVLVERRARLETTIQGLTTERKHIVARLETQVLTSDQVEALIEFAQKVAEGLEKADNSFEARRRLIELLDLRATLTIEDGVRVAYLECAIGEDRLAITSPSTEAVRRKGPLQARRGGGRGRDGRLPAGREGGR